MGRGGGAALNLIPRQFWECREHMVKHAFGDSWLQKVHPGVKVPIRCIICTSDLILSMKCRCFCFWIAGSHFHVHEIAREFPECRLAREGSAFIKEPPPDHRRPTLPLGNLSLFCSTELSLMVKITFAFGKCLSFVAQKVFFFASYGNNGQD